MTYVKDFAVFYTEHYHYAAAGQDVTHCYCTCIWCSPMLFTGSKLLLPMIWRYA